MLKTAKIFLKNLSSLTQKKKKKGRLYNHFYYPFFYVGNEKDLKKFNYMESRNDKRVK